MTIVRQAAFFFKWSNTSEYFQIIENFPCVCEDWRLRIERKIFVQRKRLTANSLSMTKSIYFRLFHHRRKKKVFFCFFSLTN